MSIENNELKKIAEMFDLKGEVKDIIPYGEGHINVTYLVTTDKKRYIMQKINTNVFRDCKSLMRNICAVTEYLQKIGAETLNVIKTKEGATYYDCGDCWRVYDFIERTVTLQTVTNSELFKNCGAAFGEFINLLAGFDASTLTEPIKDFHNTPQRFKNFLESLKKDKQGRSESCKNEIKFVLDSGDNLNLVAEGLKSGEIPLRVTHNDTKLNNILLDAVTGEARAIIDLDTIMPGSLLYDFGDSIRSGASTAAEDETDISKVHLNMEYFRKYAEGFLGAVKNVITRKEAELIPYSAYLLTMECGIRFLTDYLDGDTYFATKYPLHNLVRARTQFALAAEIKSNFDKMKKITEEILCK